MGLNDFQNAKVYFDANIFIYAGEGAPEYKELVRVLFKQIGKGKCRVVTSELTRAECLVRPLRNGDTQWIDNYKRTLRSSKTKDVLPVTADILDEAARVRAGTKNRLPDSIHIATALKSGCSFFVTNDKRIHSFGNLKIMILNDLGIE